MKKCTGTVGAVLVLEQYNPGVPDAEIAMQNNLCPHLRDSHELGTWQWEELKEDMEKTYLQQREDVVEAADAIRDAQSREANSSATKSDEDGAEERALEVAFTTLKQRLC